MTPPTILRVAAVVFAATAILWVLHGIYGLAVLFLGVAVVLFLLARR